MPTKRKDLDNQSFTDLGPGPVYLFAGQLQDVRLHFGPSQPAVDTDDFIELRGPAGRDYEGSENVYARAEGDAAFVVVVSEPV